MSIRCSVGVALALLVTGCGASGSGDAATAQGGTSGLGSGGSSGASEEGGAVNGGGGAVGSGGSEPGSGGSSTSSGGGLGSPQSTFTLPVPSAAAGKVPELYYPDLAQKFPDVAWATLDRLYIPAGKYRTIQLGGLPQRSAARPLVISNLGGQVKVGGDAANYVFVINGGSNWVLTGRYDATAKTGDAAFLGHANGAYAHSQGKYGILSDDAFSKAGLSGLSIGGRATDFELDMFEVARAEFAGIVAKTDNDATATMHNVRVHDLYVHDTGSEGIYFGSTQAQPQHSFEHLHIYQNRFLRTGTEAVQTGQLGSGCEIEHNVFGPGAVRWRSAFQQYQDGNVQLGQRYGSSSFHHNVVLGTGDLFVELFPTPVAGDVHTAGDGVVFADNYFSDTSLSGVYTHADDTGVNIRFERNVFRGFHFNYPEVYPDTALPAQVFGVGSNSPNPHVLRDNLVDGPYPFIKWLFSSVSAENNLAASVPRVRFRDFMGEALDENYRQLEWWTERATLSPDQRAVSYAKGAFVMHQGEMYQALAENQSQAPSEHPESWQHLPAPADDVRLEAGSPHAALGLR